MAQWNRGWGFVLWERMILNLLLAQINGKRHPVPPSHRPQHKSRFVVVVCRKRFLKALAAACVAVGCAASGGGDMAVSGSAFTSNKAATCTRNALPRSFGVLGSQERCDPSRPFLAARLGARVDVEHLPAARWQGGPRSACLSLALCGRDSAWRCVRSPTPHTPHHVASPLVCRVLRAVVRPLQESGP